MQLVLLAVMTWLAASVALLAVSKTAFVVVAAGTLASIAARFDAGASAPRQTGGALLCFAGVVLYLHESFTVPHVLLLAAILGLCGACASVRSAHRS